VHHPGEARTTMNFSLSSITLFLLIAAFSAVAVGQAVYNDPTITNRTFVFVDDFLNNGNQWSIGEFGNGKAQGKIEDGVYYLQSNQTDVNWAIWTRATVNQEKDFEIEARLRFVTGEDNNANCLFWGRDEQDRRFRFGISGSGQYLIDQNDGSWTNLLPWTSSDNARKTDFNKLTVRKRGDTYYFFLNEQFVHSMPYKPLYDHLLGIQVNQNTTMAVDYIRVAYLNLGTSAAYEAVPLERKLLVFGEEFDDNHAEWSVGSFGNGARSGSIENGVYTWQSHETGDYSMTWQTVTIDETNDFEIETDLRWVDGEDNNSNSIFWGRSDQDKRFGFGISGNGHYIIYEYNGSYNNFVGWTSSALVNLSGYNKLTVRKVSDEYYYFLNRKLVYTMPYRPLYGTKLGFAVNQNSRMAIDDVHVWKIQSRTSNAPPQIVVLEPDVARGMMPVSIRSLRVAGQALDADGILSVKVNGQAAVVDLSGNFFTSVLLAAGDNQITVQATDTRNMSATKTFSVSYAAPGVAESPGGAKERRIALLVGNANYTMGGSLANPVNDVRAMKTALERLHFSVLKFENCGQGQMKKVMDDFGKKLKDYDVALFFYAGHGLQVNGYNYLIPIDATLESENDAEYDCVRADRVLAKMETGGTKTNIVILDACRDNPFERSWHRGAKGTGLAFMNAPSGSVIAYSTSPGSTASDGAGANATYTAALLESLDTPGITVLQMFQRVRSLVISRTDNKQVPWESTSLRGDFYFMK
jgi:hypothetical protein